MHILFGDLQIGTDLIMAVQKALTAAGISVGNQHNDVGSELPKSEMSPEHMVQMQPKQKPAGKAEPTKPHQETVVVVGNEDGQAAAQQSQISAGLKPSKASRLSGDDLGDEFAVDIEAEEDAGKQQRKHKKAVHADPGFAALKSSGNPAKSKKLKHKVVSF